MFVYSRAALAQFYAKPNPNRIPTQTKPNPNSNLSPSSTQAVPLPGEAAIFLTEMQVAAHRQTRCRIFRFWDYKYGCRTCRQFVVFEMGVLEE